MDSAYRLEPEADGLCIHAQRDKQLQALRRWAGAWLTLSYSDATIAAVALANGMPQLTDNRKHFPMTE